MKYLATSMLMGLFWCVESEKVWERAEEFIPERFDLESPVPNESNTDYRHVSCWNFPVALTYANFLWQYSIFHLKYPLVVTDEWWHLAITYADLPPFRLILSFQVYTI